MTDLVNQKCVGHEEMKLLTEVEIKDYILELKEGWQVNQRGRTSLISKEFKFEDFKQAMEFVNKIASIAEKEGHHPDIAIYYNKVEIMLLSHFVKGLSINDFIIAAKIDLIV